MENLRQDQDASAGNRIGPNSTTLIGSTGGHWETIGGSFSIPFGSGLEVQSQYAPIIPSPRRTIYEEDKFYSSSHCLS